MQNKTKFSIKISKSISAITAATNLVHTKLTSKAKPNKKIVFKRIGPHMIGNIKKFISNPIVKNISLNFLELSTQNYLSIYSQNICWTHSKLNHLRIVEKIELLQPDIVCLQEMVFQTHLQIFNLSRYHKSIAQSSSDRIIKGGLVIYSKKQPLCVNFVKFQKQGKIFSPQLAERQLEKGFLVAEFENYLIINTHLVADQSKKWTESKLKHTNAQFAQLLEFVKLTGDQKPVFVIGDMNFCPTNESYKNAVQSGLIDITDKIPYTYIHKKVKLDYIWTNKAFSHFKSKVVRFIHQEPSDHLSIYSQIIF